MSKTIVYKSSRLLSTSDIGTVIPVAIESDDGFVRAVHPEDYPNNNKIFISKEFPRIDENYIEGELFSLSTVNENRDYLEEETNQNRSKYFSMGFYASSLETNTYLPIIEMPLPDIASGRVDHAPSIDSNRYFFIENDRKIIGPFLAQAEGESWLINPTNSISSLALPSYHVAEFSTQSLIDAGILLSYQFNGAEKRVITSLKKAKELVSFNTLDFIPDTALIRLFAKNDYGKGVGNLTKTEASKLAGIIETYSKKIKVTNDNIRTKRIKSILSEYIKFDGVGNDVVQEYLSSKAGKEFIEQYTSTNKEILLKDTIATIEQKHSAAREKFEKETAEVSSKFEIKKKELHQFELDIEKKKLELTEKFQTFSAQTKEQEESVLKDRHLKLMAEIAANERSLEDLRIKVGDYKDIDTRRSAVSKLEIKIELLREQEDKLKRSVQTQMNLIGNPQVADKLVEFRTIQMLLNGISPETNSNIQKPAILNKYISPVIGESRRSYITNLKDSFDKTPGRQYTFDELANLLITVTQSYMTILAGPPGTGKTSSAIRLAESLGLVSEQKNSGQMDNFLSVSVGRGWTSSRDLLGFHNSLKNMFQPSRSGLYSFLRGMSAGIDETANEYLKLVLFDEANLSSVEHYWSDFLLLCDTFDRPNKIDLGSGGSSFKENYLQIPSSLRFISTINNDATVEGLSHRLIDRSAIIALDYESESSPHDTMQLMNPGAVPYAELIEAFSPSRDDEELLPIESVRLKQIIDILGSGKGGPIHYSKRKTNAISRYCFVANQVGYEKIEPLDFAISQHLLPAIKGQGSGMRERLQKLEEKLEEFKYNISRKIVSRIIDASDDFSDSYSYF